MNDKVPALLRDLGATAAEVAETLRAQGFRGPVDKTRCPVAQYLVANGIDYPEVKSCSIEWIDEDGYVTCTPPATIRAFIYAFDGGAYPDLLAL